MPVRVAEEWFSICGGCEVTILDIGEELLKVLPALEFVHMPVIMDHKYHGQLGEMDSQRFEIPEAEVGIVSGGVSNEKEHALALEMRKKCKILISLGSCACFGGIPAMANNWTIDEMTEKVYRNCRSTESAPTPDKNLPKLLDRVYALDEVVKVDLSIPGCPTSPDWVKNAIVALLTGKPFAMPEKSVCDECPAKRSKKTSDIKLKRPLSGPKFETGKPYEEMQCFLEQGFVCLGPVTKAGCAGITTEVGEKPIPRCIKGYMPCRGCFGPVKEDSNPLIDYTNALASAGIDPKGIVDRKMMLYRYIGAHDKLKPKTANR
jgi:F420-non-reducing hydrogenase small subunit